MTKITYF